ncbi:hypothetical protein SBF1_1350002 [Candidatus Desulfosporosinus infrequens]|uniref:Uncharacterized protein n=1 Tax=Candidatus Desulfosporosinus infrequens TaxID=2043169 RepID=A0A2U3K4B3_9FIRM|nr:hypothetical protein SBF1_1350002 [Candidatus Desulfosporosinus infrequens]
MSECIKLGKLVHSYRKNSALQLLKFCGLGDTIILLLLMCRIELRWGATRAAHEV